MSASILQLLGIFAGLVVIAAAAFLAFREKEATWKHVMIFCLGGVLAGVSGVQFSVNDKGDVTATIGQVRAATQQAASASLEQEAAIKTLSLRVDSLQTAIAAQQDLINTKLASAGTPPPQQQLTVVTDALKESNLGSKSLFESLTRSHAFTLNAQSLAAGGVKTMLVPAPAATKPAGNN